MKLLLLIFTVAGYMLVSPAYAADDPCYEDPSCLKASNTNFDNPYHYVFVGVYPGDELLLYPLMKDHCSETTSYCAMIIATRGKSDCGSSSGETCGDIRTAELQTSAEYLNADLWHYDLPGSSEISPNTFLQVRNTYAQIAHNAGFTEVADYFKYIFKRLQFSNEKPLVVISLQPHYGSINHPEDHVIQVIDEAITDAVEDLQHAGMPIAHFYTDSRQQGSQPIFISKQNDSFLECRKGNAPLLTTHTDLTNYEVFAHGYNDIYSSQTFRAGELNPDPGIHEFCFDNTINYFDTAHRDKLFGLLLTESSQLNEVGSFSNAFSFAPMQPSDITDYLNKNSFNLLPVIEISRFFFDLAQYAFSHSHSGIAAIVQAVKESSYRGPILFMADEPLWHIRIPCRKGIETACHEISTGYARTLDAFRKIGRDLRKALPEAGVFHVEAYAELLLQKLDHPSRDVILLNDAEYVGYNCYGPFNGCGPEDISSTLQEVGHAASITDSFNISVALTSNYFNASTLFTITDQNLKALLIAAGVYPDIPVGGTLGLFCNRVDQLCITVGLPASTGPKSQMTYINWVRNSVQSLEAQHAIGRKILLIPGAFQGFSAFPAEALAIEQLDAFAQVLDSSNIFAGMGGFLWGDHQEGFFPYIGARSLSSVRSAVANTFRSRISDTYPTSGIPPAMSLVGAVDARGYFDQVAVKGATHGDIYFQSAGMDSCSLAIGNEPGRALKLNQLNHIHIPNLTVPLDIEATCFWGDQSFTRKVRFVN